MKQVVSPIPEELTVVGSCCAAFNVRKASRVITRLYAEAFAPVGRNLCCSLPVRGKKP